MAVLSSYEMNEVYDISNWGPGINWKTGAYKTSSLFS